MCSRNSGAFGAPRRSVLPALILLAGACAAPAARPTEAGELAAAVGARDSDLAALADVLRAAELEPLGLAPPVAPGPTIQADEAAPWHAFALAYEARTRAARHALLAARHAARGAGAPLPVRAMAEVEELEQPDAYVRLTATFDLLGLLGLGPARAARELADARVRRALGELEQAAWNARVEVDRARARLAAIRAQAAGLVELMAQARDARSRIEILDRHGRVAAQAVAAAELAQGRLRMALRELEGQEAVARAALAVAAGIATTSSCLDALGPGTLESFELEPLPELPARRTWLSRSPELRTGLLEHLLAEARVRAAAAARWPSFELGPHLLWRSDELLTGLIAGTSIPWPGSVAGPLAAALEEREASRSALEDALLAVEAEGRSARERLAAAHGGLEPEARSIERRTATAWRAARVRFAIEPAALGEWADALGMRGEALLDLPRARLATLEALLDLERLLGPEPRPERGAAALARGELAR